MQKISFAALLIATPSAVMLPVTVAAESPQESANGYDVAQITNPFACEKMSPGSKGFDHLVTSMAATDDIAPLETDYPGVTRYMVIAMLPLLNKSTEESMPELWVDIGKVFDANFSSVERYWMLRLFESGAGQKLIASTCANAQIEGIIDDIIDDDMTLQVETVTKAMEDTKAVAVKEALANMTDAEQRELLELAPKAGFGKFPQIRQQIVEIKTAWMNTDDPKYDDVLDKIVSEAIDEFIAAKDQNRDPKKLPAQF